MSKARQRWTTALLALAAAAVPAPAVRAQEPEVVRTGKYYAVHCHGGDELLAQKALDVVERVWPLVTATLGVAAKTPAQPLAVHVYRTIARYEQADQQLNRGKFRRNLAMSHWDSKSAHVALQPPLSDEALRALGLPGLTVQMLAWEATHVARFELCPNFRDHPMWLVDGLASWVAAKVTRDVAPDGGAGMPLVDQEQWLVQQQLAEHRLPPCASILGDAIDDLNMHDRYATRALLFAFLREGLYAQRSDRAIRAAVGTGGGTGYQQKVLAASKSALGDKLERDFARHVEALHPQWNELFRSLLPRGAEWQQVAFPDRNAIAWNLTPIQGGAFAARGRLRILPADARQLNFLFGRTEAGFYSVAFVADQGITLLRYDRKNDSWQRLGDGNAPALRLGYDIAFEVTGRGCKVTVTLDALHWDFDLPEALPQAVKWGVGAQAGAEGVATGSAGIWSDVAVTAPPK